MARAGMAEGCSTIAGADGGRVFVHLKASPSQPRMRNIIYPDPREGGKLRRTTARAFTSPSLRLAAQNVNLHPQA